MIETDVIVVGSGPFPKMGNPGNPGCKNPDS